MRYFIDIDNTICYYKNGNQGDYTKALPYKDRIEKINKLYDEGHKITYWTARGTKTGINWFEITLDQFEQWNVKYTELRVCKPIFDVFIDDKAFNSKAFFEK